MPVLRIIAIDGAAASDFGWAIPVMEEADRFHLLGDTVCEGWDLTELPQLAESKHVTLVHPADYEFDEVQERTNLEHVNDLFACRSFEAPVMALHWREEAASHEAVAIKELTARCVPLTAKSAETQIRLLPVSKLIVCLRAVVAAICRGFVRELADDLHEYISPFVREAAPAFAKNGRLQSLADAAYRMAPDRGWAKEAIAQKTLLLMLGDHPASVPSWLATVAPYWGLPSTLDYWQAAAAGVWAAADNSVVLERIAASLKWRKHVSEHVVGSITEDKPRFQYGNIGKATGIVKTEGIASRRSTNAPEMYNVRTVSGILPSAQLSLGTSTIRRP